VPSDLVLKTMNTLHRGMLKLTGGRVGWDAGNMPVVELTTTGRRSGRPHTVMLTSPVRDGDTWVLVASRGGDDHHPAWFLNLSDDPAVEAVVKGGDRRPMRARVAGADERAELWPRVTAAQPRYAGYQRRTRREIPLVVLEPVDG
jgi:deazaflavin-dependent oxidoreductase (nitroreductase family)